MKYIVGRLEKFFLRMVVTTVGDKLIHTIKVLWNECLLMDFCNQYPSSCHTWILYVMSSLTVQGRFGLPFGRWRMQRAKTSIIGLKNHKSNLMYR